MKKNALAKHDEIHSTMTETNKRRKQIGNQLKKKEEELEELRKVNESPQSFSQRFHSRACAPLGARS